MPNLTTTTPPLIGDDALPLLKDAVIVDLSPGLVGMDLLAPKPAISGEPGECIAIECPWGLIRFHGDITSEGGRLLAQFIVRAAIAEEEAREAVAPQIETALRQAAAQTRLWWPETMVDEFMPPGRANPGDWILPGNGPLAAPRLITNVTDDGTSKESREITIGETIAFCYVDDLGSVTFTRDAGGIWHEPTCPQVEIATTFCVDGDSGTLCDTATQMCEMLAEIDRELPNDNGDTVVVQLARWSDDVPVTVERDETGALTLHYDVPAPFLSATADLFTQSGELQ